MHDHLITTLHLKISIQQIYLNESSTKVVQTLFLMIFLIQVCRDFQELDKLKLFIPCVQFKYISYPFMHVAFMLLKNAAERNGCLKF